MIEVILFDEEDTIIAKMERKVVPRIGESIVIDCGHAVEVLAVSHQWDDPDFVQVKTRRFSQ